MSSDPFHHTESAPLKPSTPPPTSPPPLWQAVVAGSAGGVANTIVGHPLDTLKVEDL